MRPIRKSICYALVALMIVQSATAPQVRAEHWLKHALTRSKPPTGKDHSVEQLAKEIDYLEHHIDTFGTVVAKHPDVWGQARLTKHRQEYERKMQAQIDYFYVALQGAVRRSDQAYLGMALALNSAAGGGASATAVSAQAPAADKGLNPPDASSLLSPPADIMRPSGTGKPDINDFANHNTGISLEPTTVVDQLNRYLNHLQELRRINEGDDTADSPGYSLNLVRIPVSVTPGKLTRKGYGAEITVTAEPYLSDELLPMTFRNLVVNDIVDLLGLGITKPGFPR